MRVLFAGGGTGGHIYPGLTIAMELLRRDSSIEVLFVGTQRGLEKRIVPQAGFRLETIDVRGFPRKPSIDLLRALGVSIKGVLQAAAIVRRFRPDVAVGTGGYVAGPAILSAVVGRVPTLIQEQNAFPGLTNRWLSRVVDKIALGLDEAKNHFPAGDKLVFTGNPIRLEILTRKRSDGLANLGLRSDRITVLIVGASQGARAINEAVVGMYDRVRQWNEVQVIHQTGLNQFDTVAQAFAQRPTASRQEERIDDGNIHVFGYLDDMPSALAAADIVISRAGAISIAEITARGLPAILIPFPHAAENHQEKNARVLEQAGAARVLLDRDVSVDTLVAALRPLVEDVEEREARGRCSRALGRPYATGELADMIMDLAKTGRR